MPTRILPLLLVVCVAACAPASLLAQPSRPNILLIVSDDAGYADVGFRGGRDLSEKRNMADAEPKRVQELLSRISEWERPLPPPRWDTGPVWEATHIKYHTDPPIYQWTGFSPAPAKK